MPSFHIWAKVKHSFDSYFFPPFLAKHCSKHLPSAFNTCNALLVSEASEAGTEMSIKISHRGHPLTATKKCHHLCVILSHVGGQVYWHLDDHPGPFSLPLIDCNSTYISQQQGQAHVSFVREVGMGPCWHQNKAVRIQKPWRTNPVCQLVFASKHDLQEGKGVPMGAWAVWLC